MDSEERIQHNAFSIVCDDDLFDNSHREEIPDEIDEHNEVHKEI